MGGGWWGASTLNDHFLTVPPSTLSLPPSFLQFPLYQRECVCKKKGVGSGSELVTSGGCHSSKNRTAGCWVAWRARGSPGSFSHNASKRVRKKKFMHLPFSLHERLEVLFWPRLLAVERALLLDFIASYLPH